MERIKIAPTYDYQWLQIERPKPLSDNKIEQLTQDVLDGKLNKDISDQVYIDFKNLFTSNVFDSNLNNIRGYESFLRSDICIGCTQFIDTLYMNGPLQFFKGEYRYHTRLNPDAVFSVPGYLRNNVPLIVSLPFPNLGSEHTNMQEILDECLSKKIDVHIDGAWITASRDIDFDFSHPAIKSFAISLSKGYGLGWNRIGLRWTKQKKPDAITIMNDFHMNNRALAMIGLHFLRNLGKDYLWKTHEKRYYQVCKDFNLTPTKTIHLALLNNQPVGVSSLIRYLENEST